MSTFSANPAAYSTNKDQLLMNIYKTVKEYSYVINSKATAIYDNVPTPTNGTWYMTLPNLEKQMITRKCFNIGALPNTGVMNVAHNLNVDPTGAVIPTTAEWTFVSISGTAKDPIAIRSIVLPSANVDIQITSTNIEITTFANLAAYTDNQVTLEYTQP